MIGGQRRGFFDDRLRDGSAGRCDHDVGAGDFFGVEPEIVFLRFSQRQIFILPAVSADPNRIPVQLPRLRFFGRGFLLLVFLLLLLSRVDAEVAKLGAQGFQ